jgi:hypothetical protein
VEQRVTADLDPRTAIIEYLSRPAADQPQADRAARSASQQPGRPVASVTRGNPFTADLATIEFVKERGSDDRRLFAVTFEDVQRNQWFWLAAAERDQTGSWVARGVAGGSDGPRARSAAMSTRSQPWLNLAGSWGQGRIYAGGKIHSAGADIGQLCLTLADGTQLTDDADAGVALFLSDQTGQSPASVDIFDTHGRILVHQAA